MSLTPVQRRILTVIATVGFFGFNGVFGYYAIFRPVEVMAEFGHPVAMVFIVEALALVALGAAMLHARPLGRHGAGSFVVLSLLGGLLFSVPAILLLNDRRAAS
jgi:predicted membrane channel-forming protein YqfA (hemolysin III family)